MTSTRWIVAQLGAREHYAIPYALQQSGCETRLFTDFWIGGIWRPLAPSRMKDRRREGFREEAVTSLNGSLMSFEARARLRRMRGWPLIEARNSWFDRSVARNLKRGSAKTLFAYSYAARETLRAARRLGMRTILGQIDPGPAEWRLVRELRERAGLPREDQPSPAYWESWREECDSADAIVVNSTWSKRALLDEGIPAERIHIVPLAFEGAVGPIDDVEAAVPVFTKARPLQVLFLGQVIVRKGILEIIEAIDRLSEAAVTWTFAGGGDAALLEELRRRPKARILGQVRRQEAGLHYRAADIFLLPTHSDGFAITQLEAAAHGLPIIASRHCGDVVQDGVTGLLLNGVTGEAIAAAVSTILRQPSRLATFREEQRRQPRRSLANLAGDLLDIAMGISVPTAASTIHVDC